MGIRALFRRAAVLLLPPLLSTAAEGPPTGHVSPSVVRRVPARARTVAAEVLAENGAKGVAALPSSWDSRDHGWITPVRNQSPWGTCWAFSALATVEAQLVKSGRASVGDCDLSERHMAMLHGFNAGLDDGGNDLLAGAYLLRWEGAVKEAVEPYRATAACEPHVPAVRVQNVVWISPRKSARDNAALKSAIMEYGAVSVAYYHVDRCLGKAGAYYYGGTSLANHAVAAVGWDDKYSATNFASRPDGNGAWLVKNSWGTGYGDRGYLHVSYYDQSFAAEDSAVFVPATDAEDYTTVYGYDRLGPYLWFSDTNILACGAVFRSSWNEELAAVGVYADTVPLAYRISVCTNVVLGGSGPLDGGAVAAMKTGTILRRGFSTIPLDAPVPLADRQAFSVVFEERNNPEPVFLMCCTNAAEYSTFDPVPGRTFVRFGDVWEDTATTDLIVDDDTGRRYRGNLCLKAYARATAAAPAGDRPDAAEPGGAMALDLRDHFDEELFSATSGTFGSFAGIVGANGRSLWASWLIGLNPGDPAANGLRITRFGMSDDGPVLIFEPDLGTNRTYTVYGTETLAAPDWKPVGDLRDTPARFFRVGVSQ